MCLSIPGQVKETPRQARGKYNKKSFVIQYNQQEVKVPNSIIEGIEEGDWVIVQNKCIAQKLTKKQADEFFKLIK